MRFKEFAFKDCITKTRNLSNLVQIVDRTILFLNPYYTISNPTGSGTVLDFIENERKKDDNGIMQIFTILVSECGGFGFWTSYMRSLYTFLYL